MAKLTNDIWDKSKDGSKKEQRSFLRFAIIVTALFLLFICVKKDSLIRWIETGFTIRRQNSQIEWYQGEISKLDTQIEKLSTQRDSLETFAREKFHFSEPGDDVYLEEGQ
ncbi:MAG: septum formation initiator family protein [Bacteroidales bacterium]|jgi:cell division protein FtsB|nr:septum formation initiator family protein [Bacteroidales bacterium]MCR5245267.1 septum formation initiator family protein [Bacteroidales bacterium]